MAAAAAAGILLALGSVAVATPAHADNEVGKAYCAFVGVVYAPAQFAGCADLE
ncbi:hypothetical protein [Streptomyces sp. NPDC021096]|uniref:hypothetical protein n=1 Tax=Streptomyces sp. NPDC021096 TaxID=3154792 RepID=UPI00340CFEFB